MNLKHKTVIADILLLLVAFIWGSTFVLVKNAIDILPPFSFNAIRFLLAAAFLLFVLLAFYRKVFLQINRKLLLAGTFIGIFLFGGYAFQTFGLLYTTASKAGFITGLSVVMVPIFTILFLKEVMRRQVVIGVFFATIGLFLLSINSSLKIDFGDFLIFLCAICYALHIIFVGKWSPGSHALNLAFVQITVVGILNLIAALLFEDFRRIEYEILFVPEVLWGLLITAFFATALAFLIQTAAQKFTSPTKTALIFATEPVFAALAGYYLASEVLTMKEWIGCLMILAGMVMAEWPSPSERKTIQMIKEQNEKSSDQGF